MRTVSTLLLLCGCSEHYLSAKLYEGVEPGDCADRADNDADGIFDCNDEDCFGSPDCVADSDTDLAETDLAETDLVETDLESEETDLVETDLAETDLVETDLESEETDLVETDLACNTVVYGNVYVTNSFDLIQLRCVVEVTGDLYIDGAGNRDLSDLSSLQVVGGVLLVMNNPNLTSLEHLQDLREVGGIDFGGIAIRSNPSLTAGHIRGNVRVCQSEIDSFFSRFGPAPVCANPSPCGNAAC